MTNLQIQMLIHYYCTPEPYSKLDVAHANSSAVQEQREQLVSWGMLTRDVNGRAGYICTEKAEVWIKYINDLPIPMQSWRMPWRMP